MNSNSKKITDGNYDKSLAIKCNNGTFVGKKTDEPTAIKTAFMSPDQILNIDPDELVGDNSPFIKAGLSDEDNLDVPAFFRKQAD